MPYLTRQHHNSKSGTPLNDRELLRRFKRFIDKTDSDNIEVRLTARVRQVVTSIAAAYGRPLHVQVLLSNLSIYDALEKYKRRKPKLPHSDDPIDDVVQLFKYLQPVPSVNGWVSAPDLVTPQGVEQDHGRERCGH